MSSNLFLKQPFGAKNVEQCFFKKYGWMRNVRFFALNAILKNDPVSNCRDKVFLVQ